MSHRFFIDTADHLYIEEKWNLLKEHAKSENFLGITTNPNAFAKENLSSLRAWEDRTRVLVKLVSQIKKRDCEPGVVYVQIPSDDLTEEEVMDWANLISKWGDTNTQIALKIPPYKKYLEMIDDLCCVLDVNVTGVADCSTALRCAVGNPRFISVIPGRMEEVGIDAKKHVAYLMDARKAWNVWDIITGSMRTLEGLKWCVEYGTVPTVGKRVLDLMNEKNCAEVMNWTTEPFEAPRFSPEVDHRSRELSEQFFVQMNSQGAVVKSNFLSNK